MSRFFAEKYASLTPYTPGEQPKNMQYVKLNTNESPFPPSPGVAAAVQAQAGKLQLYSDPETTALREYISEHKLSSFLRFEPTSKRYYPQATTGSHVLGFMAQNENSGGEKVGAQGLEALYQETLIGEKGRVVTSRNALGGEMLSNFEEYIDAEDGYNLNLTLDAGIQSLLEQALAEGIETYDVKNGAFAKAERISPKAVPIRPCK